MDSRMEIDNMKLSGDGLTKNGTLGPKSAHSRTMVNMSEMSERIEVRLSAYQY